MKITRQQLKQLIKEELEEVQEYKATRKDLARADHLKTVMQKVEEISLIYSKSGEPGAETIVNELDEIASKLAVMVQKLSGNPSPKQIAQREKRAADRRTRLIQQDMQAGRFYEPGRDRDREPNR